MEVHCMTSAFTHVRVNNEIELCEVHSREIKEKIRLAFAEAGIPYFMKVKKENYVICINERYKRLAEELILAKLENAREIVTFYEPALQPPRPNRFKNKLMTFSLLY